MWLDKLIKQTSKQERWALATILFTNVLFANKYLSRGTNYALFIALAYGLFLVAAYLVLPISKKYSKKARWNVFLFPIIVLVAFLLFQKIDPESVKVDRWSVITSFWDQCFKGNYPYFAESHMGAPPGPMPVYFILALPFYFIGEIGWMAVAGLLLFLRFVYNKAWQPQNTLALTLLSIAVLYEILVRSTIFTNSAILCIFLYHIKDYPYKKSISLIVFGLLAGLLLSTRMVYGLCFAIYLVHGLKSKQINFGQAAQWSLWALIGFLITFLPIYLAFPNDFWVQNPFNIQGTYSMEPFWQPIFLLIALLLAWFTKENNNLNFAYGMALFLPIFIYLIYHIFLLGIEGIHNGRIDISYFLFSFPFLLMCLKQDWAKFRLKP